jgi:hypothetical protein
MKNYLNYLAIMMLSMGMFFSSCTKEVVGPQGPQGEQGVEGADGQDGSDGQDGNANVKAYSFTAQPSAWTSFGTQGDAGYGFGISYSLSAITASIVNNGTVLVFWNTGSAHIALPYSFPENGYTETYLYGYYTGGVAIERYDTDLLTTAPGDSRTFKIIVIGGSSRLANPDLDLTNYEEVMGFYGLKDK